MQLQCKYEKKRLILTLIYQQIFFEKYVSEHLSFKEFLLHFWSSLLYNF